MDALSSETEDSRTATVGRKRAAPELEHPQEVSSDLSDEERSYKRARQESDVAFSNGPVEDQDMSGTLLPLAPDLPQTEILPLASTERVVTAPTPMTWNRGVESSIRTSFGAKSAPQSIVPPRQTEPETEDKDGRNGGTTAEAPMETQMDTAPPDESSDQNKDTVIQPQLVPQPQPIPQPQPHPQPDQAERDKPLSRKARKKNQSSASDPNSNNAKTKNLSTPVSAPTSTPTIQRDPQLPSLNSATAKHTYKNGVGEFDLDELRRGDKQIRLADLTPDMWAKHFLATNAGTPGKLDSLTPKHLKGAWSTYLSAFYGHLPKPSLDKARARRSKSSSNINKYLREAKKGILYNKPAEKPAKDDMAKADASKPSVPSSPKLTAEEASTESDLGAAGSLQVSPADAEATPSAAADDDDSSVASSDSDREEGEMSSDAADIDIVLTDLEIEMLQKYYPDVPGSMVKPTCLACAGSGHKTYDCPSLACKVCGKTHSTPTCPQSARCLKCRERGHLAKDCPEKLLKPLSQGDGCDLCQSQDHLENKCHLLWRTYRPKPSQIRKVRDIPVSCYVCGASGHYGPECGLHTGKIRSGGITWSRANLVKYLDPSSSERAISAGPDFSLPKPTKKAFNIKGQAGASIMLDDSDEDVEFIQPAVKKAVSSQNQQGAMNQHIHFAGNQTAIPPPPASGAFQDRNPPRQPRAQIGNFGNGLQDSARNGREREFSPPPRFNDFRAGFNENDRYLPQAPPRTEYKPPNGEKRLGPANNGFRGGSSGRGRIAPPRGGRGGGGGGRGRRRG